MRGERPFRIAVHATAEPGARAGRILLGEPDLIELGTYRCSFTTPGDSRVQRTDDLSGFDVLASDDTGDPLTIAAQARTAGIPCVLWSDLWEGRAEGRSAGDDFARSGLTLLLGAALGPGIAHALASHEVARLDRVTSVSVGWTVPGRPLRRGEALPFPEPVGSLWARETDDPDLPSPAPTRRLVAPLQGDWAGATARVSGTVDGRPGHRVVGVADHAGHLEGLALAAGAVAVVSGGYGVGLQWPSAADTYLEHALAAGLTVATFTGHDD